MGRGDILILRRFRMGEATIHEIYKDMKHTNFKFFTWKSQYLKADDCTRNTSKYF